MKMPDAAWVGLGLATVGAIGGALLKSFSVGMRLGTVEERQIGMKGDLNYLRTRFDQHIEDEKDAHQQMITLLQELKNGKSQDRNPLH